MEGETLNSKNSFNFFTAIERFKQKKINVYINDKRRLIVFV